MGCSSTHTISDESFLRPMTLSLTLPKESTVSLTHAHAIITSISKLRNRMITIYHKLLYKTGACLYIAPTIVHCVKSVFFKLSAELGGSLEKSNLAYIEDPPYLQMEMDALTEDTRTLLQGLFDFITEIRSYKALIKQIDKDTPELLYLIFENKDNISEENINEINKGVDIFKQIIKFRYGLLQQYKNEVYSYVTKNEMYCKEINRIGKEAHEQNITDIYKIVMLSGRTVYNNKNDRKFYSVYANEENAKKDFIEIMNNDIDEELNTTNSKEH